MPKPKKVSYLLVSRDSDEGRSIYAMLDDLVSEHHEHLVNARLVVAWNLTWQPDVDGRVTLGKCKKASDLDRELAPFDFVILLRKEFFEDADVTDDQRRALLDHELCHAEDGEPKVDTKGRTVYRIRKHDIEEFTAVVSRHGIWKRDIETFAAAIERSKRQPSLFPGVKESIEALRPKPGSGLTAVELTFQGKGVRFERAGATVPIGHQEPDAAEDQRRRQP